MLRCTTTLDWMVCYEAVGVLVVVVQIMAFAIACHSHILLQKPYICIHALLRLKQITVASTTCPLYSSWREGKQDTLGEKWQSECLFKDFNFFFCKENKLGFLK